MPKLKTHKGAAKAVPPHGQWQGEARTLARAPHLDQEDSEAQTRAGH